MSDAEFSTVTPDVADEAHAVGAARAVLRSEVAWLVIDVAVAALVGWIATAGVPDVLPAMLWALVGAQLCLVMSAAGRVFGALVRIHRVARCLRCRDAVRHEAVASSVYRRCARFGHDGVAR